MRGIRLDALPHRYAGKFSRLIAREVNAILQHQGDGVVGEAGAVLRYSCRRSSRAASLACAMTGRPERVRRWRLRARPDHNGKIAI